MEKKPVIRRWGWWAVAGLAVVLIVVSVIAILGGLQQPVPSANLAEESTSEIQQNQSQGEIVVEPDTEELDQENSEAQVESGLEEDFGSNVAIEDKDLPRTGPENWLWLFVLVGFLSYLVTLIFMERRRKSANSRKND